MGRRMLAGSVVCCLILASRDAIAQKVEIMTVPSFGTVTIYAPQGAPKAVVLFVSGDGGWSLGVVPMAEQLRAAGALVVGIDIRLFMKSLNTVGTCRISRGLARGAVARRPAPYEGACVSAAYPCRILVGRHAGVRRRRCGAAGNVCGRRQSRVLPRHRDSEAAVSHARPGGDEEEKSRVRPRAVCRIDRALDGAAGRGRSGL